MKWFSESNRWRHFLGGVAIGILSNTPYCAALAGIGVAGALEFKDKQHNCKWDWIDFSCTVAGVAIGYAIRYGSLILLWKIQ